MAAKIRTQIWSGGAWITPVSEASRNDVRRGDLIQVHSVDAATTTYNWSLVFIPDSAGPEAADINPSQAFDGTVSSAILAATNLQTTTFSVDHDGSYLVRLIIDGGVNPLDTQYVRVRSLTTFANLKLSAAGERRDAVGVIPVDLSTEGWTDDLNQNLLRLAAFVRRTATSGRVLYVDSNRGRDSTSTPSDYTNYVRFPGTNAGLLDETGIRARSEGFADFDTITNAITYAASRLPAGTTRLTDPDPLPSATDPYIILVKPGLYAESVAFVPFVYVIAESLLNPMYGGVIIRAASGSNHTFTAPVGVSDYTLLAGLTLQNYNTVGIVDDPVLVQSGGTLELVKCVLEQRRVAVDNESALKVDSTTFAAQCTAKDCQFTTAANTPVAYAITTLGTNPNILTLEGCTATGPSVLEINTTPEDSHYVYLRKTLLVTTDDGYALNGVPTNLFMRDVEINKVIAVLAEAILLEPYGAWALGDVRIDIQDTSIVNAGGNISFDPTGIGGTPYFNCNNLQMSGGTIVYPSIPGLVPTTTSTALGKSIQYDHSWTKPEDGLLAVAAGKNLQVHSVQDAIDLLTNIMMPLAADPFHSLSTAYDGVASWTVNGVVTYGAGNGRAIVADSGAVQISGATPPVQVADTSLNGGLQVEGVIDVGPLVSDGYGSEICIQPEFGAATGAANGCGPFISMGRTLVPLYGQPLTHHGLPAAVIQAGNPTDFEATPGASGDAAPYNIFLRTRNRAEVFTGEAGRVVLQSGTIPRGDLAVDGGSVYIEAGANWNPTPANAIAGDIYLQPGFSNSGAAHGKAYLSDPTTAVRASLKAQNAPAGPPIGVAGTFWIATPHGVESFAVLAGDNLAAVIATVNTTSLALQAWSSAGKLQLDCRMPGANGDVLYLGDSVAGALNTALGNLNPNTGATFTPGAVGTLTDLSLVGVSCTDVGSGGVAYLRLTSAIPGGQDITIKKGILPAVTYTPAAAANAGAAAVAIAAQVNADPTRTVNAYTANAALDAQATVIFVGITANALITITAALAGSTLSNDAPDQGKSTQQQAAEGKRAHNGRYTVTAADVATLLLANNPYIVIGAFDSTLFGSGAPETVMLSCRTSNSVSKCLATVDYQTEHLTGSVYALLLRDVGAVLDHDDILDYWIIG